MLILNLSDWCWIFLNNAGYRPVTTFGTSVPGNYGFVTNLNLVNSSFISRDTVFMKLNWVTLCF
jgi:hypothetical protein